MSGDDWTAGHVRCLGVHLMGGHIDVDEYGTPIIGDHLLILFNADHATEIPFSLPKLSADCGPWERLFDTALDKIDAEPAKAKGEEIVGSYKVLPCSMVVFRAHVPQDTDSLTAR
jgi:glycogen operon protein